MATGGGEHTAQGQTLCGWVSLVGENLAGSGKKITGGDFHAPLGQIMPDARPLHQHDSFDSYTYRVDTPGARGALGAVR